MSVEVRRGSDRFLTREVGRQTRHSFSFGPHYDQDNLGFGPLVCHDDHLLRPGTGFGDHPHTDLEIVTWVVVGALVHTGPDGESHRLEPGTVQVQTAGSGVRHGEVAADDAGPTRFVQMWLRPDRPGAEPTTDRATPDLEPGSLTPVVSPGGPLRIGTSGATLYAARLAAGDRVALPEHPLQHVYLVTGSLARSSLAQPLDQGDAFRISDRPGLELTAASSTLLLVWAFR
jgi:hypothetical protein